MAESSETANGTKLSEAVEYAGVDAPSGVRAQALLRDAERTVRDIAPPPESTPDAYKTDAKDAEMYVFSYFAANPGYISSASSDDVSITFAKHDENNNPMQRRVEAIMSRWLRGTPPRATVSSQRYSNVLKPSDKW